MDAASTLPGGRVGAALRQAFPARYPVVPPGAPGRRWPRWALAGLLVIAYLPLFVPGAFNAFWVLLTRQPPPWASEGQSGWGAQVYHLLQNAGATVIVVAFSLLVIRLAGLSWAQAGLSRPRSAADWSRQVWAFVAASGALVGGFLFSLPLPGGLGHFPVGGAWLYEFGGATLAGFQEELPLTVLLVVLCRLAGLRWLWVIVVACCFRVLFHLYYGPQAVLAIAVWIPLTVLTFRRLGAAWAIVAAHSVHDLGAFAGDLANTLLSGAHPVPLVALPLALLALAVSFLLPCLGFLVAGAMVGRDLWRGFSEPARAPTSTAD